MTAKDPKTPLSFEALRIHWPLPERTDAEWQLLAKSTLKRIREPDQGSLDDCLGVPRFLDAPSGSQADDSDSFKELALISLELNSSEQTASADELTCLDDPSQDIPRTSEIRATRTSNYYTETEHQGEVELQTAEPQAAPTPISHISARRYSGTLFIALVAAAAGWFLRPVLAPQVPELSELPVAMNPNPRPNHPATALAVGGAAQANPQALAGPDLEIDDKRPRVTPPSKLASGAGATAPRAPDAKMISPGISAEPSLAQNDPAQEAHEKREASLIPASSPTERPLEPSTGAALAALGQVMGGAKACVAGHPSASSAVLSFRSDGTVEQVEISGPAAGTRAENCIRSALSGARVAPFTKRSFSIRTPIRP